MAKAVHVSGAMGARKTAVEETVSSILRVKGDRVWQISPTSTVFDAIAEMARHGVGALPVVSAEDLVGIITERDYARKVILLGRSSQRTMVSEIMTPSPITITPHFKIHECLRIMSTHRFRHLPVVESGRLCGIISIGDLVNAIIANQAFTIDQLETYIATDYPG